uniref:Uncharacterized protein n=1 Tax=Ascaris lumbricoides TaxID=6252 RepID=A0A0M3IWS1_ASCLU
MGRHQRHSSFEETLERSMFRRQRRSIHNGMFYI